MSDIGPERVKDTRHMGGTIGGEDFNGLFV
jgi:hypothetical protein